MGSSQPPKFFLAIKSKTTKNTHVLLQDLKIKTASQMIIYFLLLIPLLTTPPLAVAQVYRDDPPMYDVHSDLDSTAQLIFVVVVAAFLITGFLSVCIHQCYHVATDAGGGIPLHTDAGANRQRRLSPSGLDPAVINSFPVFDYSAIKHLKFGKGELSCAVCVSEFEDGEKLRLLTKCDHVFHPECIDLWLASHSTCPICRANLSRGSESTQSTEACDSTAEVVGEVENRNQVAVDVDGNERVDREPRGRVGLMFPRPHSTGHSLVRLGEECGERYMLRLPDELRRQVDRLDRGGTSDRWFCTMTPPFFSRTGSLRLANLGFAGKSEPMSTGLPV